MAILLIDTCGQQGSVALATTGSEPERLFTRQLPGRAASEKLLSEIKHLASESGVSLHALRAIAVVHGPGSFTGVRVGLSAAKGLCEALGIPLVAISRLAVLAHLAAPNQAAKVRALLDAGRGEFYSGLYQGSACLREELLTRDQLLAETTIEAAELVACEPAVAQALAAQSVSIVHEPRAEDALPIALKRIAQASWSDIASIDANYLRRTDAEIFAKQKAAASAAV